MAAWVSMREGVSGGLGSQSARHVRALRGFSAREWLAVTQRVKGQTVPSPPLSTFYIVSEWTEPALVGILSSPDLSVWTVLAREHSLSCQSGLSGGRGSNF